MDSDRRLFLFAAAALPLYAGPLLTFTADEARLVTALTDQIIPADDAPGAVAAGVIFYIDRQLAGPLKRFRTAYRTGLVTFDTACRERMKRGFLELNEGEKMQFLLAVESTPFFNMVVDHTMQGFYGSPAHGGNRDGASWKMLAIEDVMSGHKPGHQE